VGYVPLAADCRCFPRFVLRFCIRLHFRARRGKAIANRGSGVLVSSVRDAGRECETSPSKIDPGKTGSDPAGNHPETSNRVTSHGNPTRVLVRVLDRKNILSEVLFLVTLEKETDFYGFFRLDYSHRQNANGNIFVRA
jgi:hypothetical protein